MSYRSRSKFDRVKSHWLFRYGLSIVLFAATLGLSLLLTHFGIKLSLTIPIVFALVAAVWYGGRGPGLLISALFHATTIYFTPVPAEPNWPQIAFGHISVF